MSTPHWTDPDQNKIFSGVDNEKMYLSPESGYYIVETDGAVWECDFRGFRVPELPEDAVGLVPKASHTPSCGLCTDAGRFLNINDECPEHGEKDLEED